MPNEVLMLRPLEYINLIAPALPADQIQQRYPTAADLFINVYRPLFDLPYNFADLPKHLQTAYLWVDGDTSKARSLLDQFVYTEISPTSQSAAEDLQTHRRFFHVTAYLFSKDALLTKLSDSVVQANLADFQTVDAVYNISGSLLSAFDSKPELEADNSVSSDFESYKQILKSRNTVSSQDWFAPGLTEISFLWAHSQKLSQKTLRLLEKLKSVPRHRDLAFGPLSDRQLVIEQLRSLLTDVSSPEWNDVATMIADTPVTATSLSFWEGMATVVRHLKISDEITNQITKKISSAPYSSLDASACLAQMYIILNQSLSLFDGPRQFVKTRTPKECYWLAMFALDIHDRIEVSEYGLNDQFETRRVLRSFISTVLNNIDLSVLEKSDKFLLIDKINAALRHLTLFEINFDSDSARLTDIARKLAASPPAPRRRNL